jgi:hypothetical protein
MAMTGPIDQDLFVEDGWHYRFVALFNDGGARKDAMAALLIASTRAAPPTLPPELVTALTRGLQSALLREPVGSTRSVDDVTA